MDNGRMDYAAMTLCEGKSRFPHHTIYIASPSSQTPNPDSCVGPRQNFVRESNPRNCPNVTQRRTFRSQTRAGKTVNFSPTYPSIFPVIFMMI